jgi:hypothetical protein
LISSNASGHCAPLFIRPPLPVVTVSVVRILDSFTTLAPSALWLPPCHYGRPPRPSSLPIKHPSPEIDPLNPSRAVSSRPPQCFPKTSLHCTAPTAIHYVGSPSHQLPINVGVERERFWKPSILQSSLTSSGMTCVHNFAKKQSGVLTLVRPPSWLSSRCTQLSDDTGHTQQGAGPQEWGPGGVRRKLGLGSAQPWTGSSSRRESRVKA